MRLFTSAGRKADYYLNGERLQEAEVEGDLGVLVHESQT